MRSTTGGDHIQLSHQCLCGGQSNREVLGSRPGDDSGLKPNVLTYISLISACEKGNETAKALEVCADVRESGLQPVVITFHALISACEQRALKKAWVILAEIMQKGLQLNVITSIPLLEFVKRPIRGSESHEACLN